MNQESINNILKYSKLNNMLNKVNINIEQKKYKEAYLKSAALLEFVNINILIKKFKIKLEDTSITNIIKEYIDKDKDLAMQMLSINTEYNTLDINNIDISDIEFLIYKTNYIVGYVTQKYGEIFN